MWGKLNLDLKWCSDVASVITSDCIQDEYVSPVVLPKESLFGWVKWDDDADFDKVVFKYEADVKINDLFDVDGAVDRNKEGIIEIPKSALVAGGFFGFNASYTTPITSKRAISFEIDLVHDDESRTITLESNITKPFVENFSTSYDQLIIDNYSPPPPSLDFDLRSVGETPVLDLEVVIDITAKDIKFDINKSEPSNEIASFTGECILDQSLTIHGKGNGFITISIEYYDLMGNKYHDMVQEIPIRMSSNTAKTIPIAKSVSHSEILYVTN